MLQLKSIHHIAIICSDYEQSKHFYTQILGFQVIKEVYRQDRDSYKLDPSLGDQYVIELFSFPNPPERTSQPEATGLRHLAFSVENIDESKNWIEQNGIAVEDIRVDQFTGRRFTFFMDPDDLPLELYEL